MAVLAVLFIASCNGTSALLRRQYDSRLPAVPDGAMPAEFPVVAVVGEDERQRAFLVKASNLDAFRQANPKLSYLVPVERESALSSGLTIWNPGRDPVAFATQSFVVEHSEGGRQRILVHSRSRGAGDDDELWVNRSVYEVHTAGITPLRHHYYSEDRAAMGMMVSALLIHVVLLVVVAAGHKLYRKTHP